MTESAEATVRTGELVSGVLPWAADLCIGEANAGKSGVDGRWA